MAKLGNQVAAMLMIPVGLKFIGRELFFLQGFAGRIVGILFIRIDIEEDKNFSLQLFAAPGFSVQPPPQFFL